MNTPSNVFGQRELTAQEKRLMEMGQGQQPHGGASLAGPVWQPHAMGGGQWINPQVVRLSDEDVDRIARAVVRLLREEPQR